MDAVRDAIACAGAVRATGRSIDGAVMRGVQDNSAAATRRPAHPSQETPPQRTDRSSWTFVALTFALSWGAWLLLVAVGGGPQQSSGGFAVWALGGLGPTVAAVALAVRGGAVDLRQLRRGVTRWRVGRWYAVLLLPLPLASAAVLGAVAAGQAPLDTSGAAQWYLLPIMFLGGIVFGGVEEVGWRGYLLPRLQHRYSALAASVIIGVLWSLWHAPLFVIEGTIQSSLPAGWFALQAIALSIVFTWVYNSTHSILLVVVLHGAINASFAAAVQWLAPAAAGDALPFAAATATVVATAVIWRHRGNRS